MPKPITDFEFPFVTGTPSEFPIEPHSFVKSWKVAAMRGFILDLLEIRFAVDGADVQDLAVKHGLLIEQTKTQTCGDGCHCAGYLLDSERFWNCYKLADWLEGMK